MRDPSVDSGNRTRVAALTAERLAAGPTPVLNLDVDLLRPILASSNLLSILDFQDTKVKVLPNEIFSLFNLRFLGIRYSLCPQNLN